MSTLEKWAHISTILQSIFIVIALFVASLEYFLHLQGDRDRKKEAVASLIERSIYAQYIDSAFGELYNPPRDEVLKLSASDFDSKIASLSNYLWAAAICAK